jgi:hypothetical protein
MKDSAVNKLILLSVEERRENPFSMNMFDSECVVESTTINGDPWRRVAVEFEVTRSVRLGEKSEALARLALAEGRVISYKIDEPPGFNFDEEKGVGLFTSDGRKFTVRALQDEDKSWVINWKENK